MFKEMRRNTQLLHPQATISILENATCGVLAVIGEDGYPYSVPLSYVYDNGKIYFHCARQGHKIDAIKANPKASFCVIAQDDVIPEKYTTLYRSAIVFGTIKILQDEKEILETITKLAVKYHSGASETDRNQEISRCMNSLLMLEMSVEHMSGKASKEIIEKE